MHQLQAFAVCQVACIAQQTLIYSQLLFRMLELSPWWRDRHHVYNKGCIWEQLWRKKVSSSERFHQSSEEGVLKERKLSRSQSVCSPANFTHIHPYFIVPLRSQTDQVMKKQTVGSCGELILKEEESTCLIKGPGKPHRLSRAFPGWLDLRPGWRWVGIYW